MKDIFKAALVLALALVAHHLQGCTEEVKKFAMAQWNKGVQSGCEMLVSEKLDGAVMAAQKGLEDHCKEQDVLDDSMCVGNGISSMISVEKEGKAEWTANCVLKMNEALSSAGGSVTEISRLLQEYWAANGPEITASLQSMAQQAMNATSGFVNQSVDASITYMCQKMVDGSIDQAILTAKQTLSDACKQAGVVNKESCGDIGTTSLDGLEAQEKEKWEAECVTKVKAKMATADLTVLSETVQAWWAEGGKNSLTEIQAEANKIMEKAKASAASQRLYDAVDGPIQGLSQKNAIPVMLGAASLVGFMTILTGAIIMRLRRSRQEFQLIEESGEEYGIE